MKKLLSIILLTLMVISFSACEPQSTYEGPWWTQYGNDPSHISHVETGDQRFDFTDTTGSKVSWIYKMSSGYSSSQPIIVNDKVYFAGLDGIVYCIKNSNGKKVWAYQAEGEFTNSLIYKDDVIYAASNDGYVYALDANKGKLLWFQSVASSINFIPIIANDLIIVGTENGYVRALSIEDGSEEWRYVLNSSSSISTDIIFYDTDEVDGGIVYFGGYDGNYYALNAKTGKFIWSSFFINGLMKTAVVYDGAIYFGSGEGIFYAINAFTGTTIWSKETIGKLYIGGPAAIANGKVYFGSYDNYFYCLDAKTGEEIWKYEAVYWIQSGATVVDNVVLFIATDGNNKYYMCVLNSETGTFLWRSELYGISRTAPSYNNGSFYVTTEAGYLYKISFPAKTVED